MDKIQGTRSHLSLDFTKPAVRSRNVIPAPSLVTPILALSTPDQIKMISASTDFPILTPTSLSHLMPPEGNVTTPNTYDEPTPIATSPATNSMINESNNNANASQLYRPSNTNNNNPDQNQNENSHNYHMYTMSTGQNLINLDNVSNINNANPLLPSPLIPATVDNANNIDNMKTDDEETKMIYLDQNTNHEHENHEQSQISSVKQHKSSTNRHEKLSNHADVEKIEKKRERNRLAAKKCRQRKIETIEDLRMQLSEKETIIMNLQTDYERLRAEKDKAIERLLSENNRLKRINLSQ